ncbi:transient receptor potential channel pyrexia-like [Gigaspora margarita]|uniref:Transient receptor potential channel pyrexia-like n=1 Tax=Gigaspora margarita TaxID=4874 RepID=A0A8H4B0M3_GIGMA|nr:transient receptor potential channel pyrexia-like [Gigaspora margarita]
MYKVITNENTKTKEISEEHYRPIIITDKEQQEKLMRSSQFTSWSIAVSHEHQEKFRLVAISCISNDDMQYFPSSTSKGRYVFTKIWKVDNDFNVEKCEIEIEYGIYKHRLLYLSDFKQFQQDTLILDYPERIKHALRYNCNECISKDLIVPPSDTIRRYFLRCLSGPYLLVDTSGRDPNNHIELYNLKTNQLMNVFKRYKFVTSISDYESILDLEQPGAFAVSSDEKLLAYVAGNDLKIYLIENGLDYHLYHVKIVACIVLIL